MESRMRFPVTEDKKKRLSNDDDRGLSQRLGKIHLDDGNDTVPTTTVRDRILDLESLRERLPTICSTIFAQLGSQQTEATYQCCLKMDLEHAGVEVLLEPEIELLYKGQVVGTRRADLVIQLQSGERAVLELKAVDQMTCDHMKQLQFYAHHMGIHRGYLINFPHDSSFPSVEGDTLYSIAPLCGMRNKLEPLILGGGAGSNLRLRNAPDTRPVEILEICGKSVTRDERQRNAMTTGSKTKEMESSSSSRVSDRPRPRPPGCFGITKANEWCKVCMREQRFCRYHQNQKVAS